MANVAGKATLTACTLSANSAGTNGGGLANIGAGDTHELHALGNIAVKYGGGIENSIEDGAEMESKMAQARSRL